MTGAALLLAALTAGAPEAAARLAQAAAPTAQMRGLDKFSGLTATFEAPVGTAVAFARLTVLVRACRAQADGSEATAYVEIVDAKAPGVFAFAGWMSAASPAVSALDHPRYDVWVLSCSTRSAPAS